MINNKLWKNPNLKVFFFLFSLYDDNELYWRTECLGNDACLFGDKVAHFLKKTTSLLLVNLTYQNLKSNLFSIIEGTVGPKMY